MPAEDPVGFEFRPITADDIPTVVEFRTSMFRELGWMDEARLAQVAPLFASYLRDTLPSGECSGWIAECREASGETRVAGTVVLVWQRVPPSVRNLVGVQVYAMGMYVTPEQRRQGVARALMVHAVDCAVENGAPLVTLHASDLGRPLYEQMGFTASSEMRLFTVHASPAAWGGLEDSSD
jgi:GNAT superfamily N-acetyltransferase